MPADPGRAADAARAAPRVIGVAGVPGPLLAAYLAARPALRVVALADPAAPPADLALAIAGSAPGATDAADAPGATDAADADPAIVAALLAHLPARVPVAACLAAGTLDDLVPAPRRGGRLVGLDLHPPADRAAAPVAEVAIPADADPERADAALAVLAAAGLDAYPVGDVPGRVVRNLAAALADAAASAAGAQDPERIVLLGINAAYALADAGAAGTAELDALALRTGLVAEGPFTATGRIGLRAVVAGLDARARAAQAAGDAAELARCRPATLLWRIATV